jgi:hypothetical protein
MNKHEEYKSLVGSNIIKYIENDSINIEGWLHIVGAFIITILDCAQKEKNINGDIVEIGNWHGKTLILFVNMLADMEKLRGFDLDIKKELIDNIAKYTDQTSIKNIILTEVDSRELKVDKIKETNNRIRIFHVDGYHTYEVALNDISIAISVTSDEGIIILDDFFSATVPGVTQAFFESFGKSDNGFYPFAIGGGKIYCCKKNLIEYYREFLFKHMPMKSNNGEDVDVLLGNKVAIYDLW